MKRSSDILRLVVLFSGLAALAFLSAAMPSLHSSAKNDLSRLEKTKEAQTKILAQMTKDATAAKQMIQTMTEPEARLVLAPISVEQFQEELNRLTKLFSLSQLRLEIGPPTVISTSDVDIPALHQHTLKITGNGVDDRAFLMFLGYLLDHAPHALRLQFLKIQPMEKNLRLEATLLWTRNASIDSDAPYFFQEKEVALADWSADRSLFLTPDKLKDALSDQLYSDQRRMKLSAVFYQTPEEWSLWFNNRLFTAETPSDQDISIQSVSPAQMRFDFHLPFAGVIRNIDIRTNQAFWPALNKITEGSGSLR